VLNNSGINHPLRIAEEGPLVVARPQAPDCSRAMKRRVMHNSVNSPFPYRLPPS
jgi:hypothetical protein